MVASTCRSVPSLPPASSTGACERGRQRRHVTGSPPRDVRGAPAASAAAASMGTVCSCAPVEARCTVTKPASQPTPSSSEGFTEEGAPPRPGGGAGASLKRTAVASERRTWWAGLETA